MALDDRSTWVGACVRVQRACERRQIDRLSEEISAGSHTKGQAGGANR